MEDVRLLKIMYVDTRIEFTKRTWRKRGKINLCFNCINVDKNAPKNHKKVCIRQSYYSEDALIMMNKIMRIAGIDTWEDLKDIYIKMKQEERTHHYCVPKYVNGSILNKIYIKKILVTHTIIENPKTGEWIDLNFSLS